MPVQPIVLYPHDVLRQPATLVDPTSDEVKRVICDLQDTLQAHHSVGIAAPQIGHGLRILVTQPEAAKRPFAHHGPLVLVNPQIVLSEGRVAFREGCMSIPGLVARVPRAQRVVVHATDAQNRPVVIDAVDFEAVILQHEIDHLDGILFIDRVRSARDIQKRD